MVNLDVLIGRINSNSILEAAADAEKRGWTMVKKQVQTKVLADNGVTIVAPSNALKDGLGKLFLLRDWQTSACQRQSHYGQLWQIRN